MDDVISDVMDRAVPQPDPGDLFHPEPADWTVLWIKRHLTVVYHLTPTSMISFTLHIFIFGSMLFSRQLSYFFLVSLFFHIDFCNSLTNHSLSFKCFQIAAACITARPCWFPHITPVQSIPSYYIVTPFLLLLFFLCLSTMGNQAFSPLCSPTLELSSFKLPQSWLSFYLHIKTHSCSKLT